MGTTVAPKPVPLIRQKRLAYKRLASVRETQPSYPALAELAGKEPFAFTKNPAKIIFSSEKFSMLDLDIDMFESYHHRSKVSPSKAS